MLLLSCQLDQFFRLLSKTRSGILSGDTLSEREAGKEADEEDDERRR